ncbi:SAM-dependent methyltransferase [Polyangium jinanense]|uniref:S-adenosyl-L-methionine-dependent methyltransferase n=1 Tax=Polyangium jinanense TaxID=2829994 RepID=A0A9X3X3G4_9BACT|nr:SAM-dependent methyltransferase [Polyangium jinanense]MDC3957979.1 SAM-dependent methyltransferase [Polyangium jinanense]MDC3983532.1 SAM-dependent methyltransferase [Polyangium jinanense]
MDHPVETTALLVAAMRAEESIRSDRLFEDPFAHDLAGEAGRAALRDYRAASGASIPIIEVRTRYYDEALLRAQDAGITQFVILAAGMDARAYRLPFRSHARLFELDQRAMIEAKARGLSAAEPRCERHALAVNLADDWPAVLLAAGFDPNAPTAWLAEGLLQYLEASVVHGLFERIGRLSARGSVLLYDVVGEALLSVMRESVLRYMRELGAPWIFATDDPASLAAAHGFQTEITDASVIGNAWGRWPFPATPPHVQGVPRGYLVEARKG